MCIADICVRSCKSNKFADKENKNDSSFRSLFQNSHRCLVSLEFINISIFLNSSATRVTFQRYM